MDDDDAPVYNSKRAKRAKDQSEFTGEAKSESLISEDAEIPDGERESSLPEADFYEAATLTEEDAEFDAINTDTFGNDLAAVMEANGYHPVILFGTNNSGKTSLLMSLFAVLRTESHSLQTGLRLAPPLLGSNGLGGDMHDFATELFEVGTQSFLKGEPIPATKNEIPFFIPVEFIPPGENKPIARFAFLESKGEWYRSLQKRGQKLSDLRRLYRELPPQIQQVLERYTGGMSFLYIAPYTQGEVYGQGDDYADVANLEAASRALVGVLKSYDKVRQNSGLSLDQHLMLVTKWDRRVGARQGKITDRAGETKEDREDLGEFFAKTYSDVRAEFNSISVEDHQKGYNAYCSGIIGENGLQAIDRDDELRDLVNDYPIRLWRWLYRNAMLSNEDTVGDPFPQKPQEPFLLRKLKGLLNALSGGAQ